MYSTGDFETTLNVYSYAIRHTVLGYELLLISKELKIKLRGKISYIRRILTYMMYL